ncbi:helix-turn-helix transcriptional regulator [Aphanothece sacrum]|uniref:Transcriptional regulator n=1 Tax=Aphanothece sacrum FPU1 TaxID=1920663 RepID=A0A401IGQ3_APHSA|nr:helix-turn-helix transcriptional regulator [Aphanothece sacrum]GBF80399.1 transcriptional regulator [Aphanothece sacrum FPU1]GBF84894.1 transcriptional regulator [Aphanothece sacrum FPU3]
MNIEIIQKEGKPHVIIPYEMYEKLLEDSEMLSDIKLYDEVKAHQEEFFPSEVVYRMTIKGENSIKVLREYRGLSQQQLAEIVGIISTDELAEVESNNQTVSEQIIKLIAASLDVDIEMIS